MTVRDDFLAANLAYAEAFHSGELQVRPARSLAILTCMDSRYTAQGVLGVDLGDAHVIRNAGGRVTDDALRSLVLSAALLGTRQCVLIHHSDCGLLGRSNEELRARVAEVSGVEPAIDFLPFDDLEQSVRDDLQALRTCPLFPPDYETLGFTYDVRTGRLAPVER
ncbi:MAG: carbonic anhydrase [Chloroflexi bacterium]|nr:carbonic anhydrase [Chloroflexota bacterium]MDA1003872.1 carbonic anhydrase [Chloroflexota bacterium]